MTSEFSSDGRGNGRRRHIRMRLLRKDIKELKEALYKVQQELEVTTTILLDECYNLNMQIRQLGGVRPSDEVARPTWSSRCNKLNRGETVALV
jgi:hypothetical protein